MPPSASRTWPTARRALGYTSRYRGLIASCVIALLCRGACSLVGPLILRRIIDVTIPSSRLNEVLALAAAMLVVEILDGTLGIAQRGYVALVGESLVRDLRVALYSCFQRRSLAALTASKTGDSLSRINNDVSGAQNLVMLALGFSMTAVLAAATFTTMTILEWRLALASLVAVPLLFGAVRVVASRQRELSREVLRSTGELTAMAGDSLNIGAAVMVRLLGREQEQIASFTTLADAVMRVSVRRNVVGAIFFAIASVISAAGVALVFGIGGSLVIHGRFTVGTIVAFAAYLTNLYSLLRDLGGAPIGFATSLTSFERVFDILDERGEADDVPDAIRPAPITVDVEFRHVSFAYEGATVAHEKICALEDVSFRARAGHIVALVGPSGAGKTTIGYLLTRLVDPLRGEVLIDGCDVRRIARSWLRRQVAMVPQDPYLFHDTVAANLRFGRPDASQADLEAAARAACIHDRIMSLDGGYGGIVGERGFRFSGGEKQRLALARVFLQDPRVLICDEATSHLDPGSESAVQRAILNLARDRVCLVIAHSLSAILHAHWVVVVKDGRVVEQGPRSQLASTDGTFARLFAAQHREAAKGDEMSPCRGPATLKA